MIEICNRLFFNLSALIAGAISQSGTAYTPHAISRDAKSMALSLGRQLGCIESSSSQLLNCLRNVDPNVLVSETASLFVRISI